MKKSIFTLSLFFAALFAFNYTQAQVAVGEEKAAKRKRHTTCPKETAQTSRRTL